MYSKPLILKIHIGRQCIRNFHMANFDFNGHIMFRNVYIGV